MRKLRMNERHRKFLGFQWKPEHMIILWSNWHPIGEEQMWGGGENKVKALSSRIVACLLLLFELWHSTVVRSLASNTTWYNKLIGLSCH